MLRSNPKSHKISGERTQKLWYNKDTPKIQKERRPQIGDGNETPAVDRTGLSGLLLLLLRAVSCPAGGLSVTRLLAADADEEITTLDGATPEIEQLIMAAGTISFFGTRRVVVLPEIDPAAYGEKDLEELCDTLGPP